MTIVVSDDQRFRLDGETVYAKIGDNEWVRVDLRIEATEVPKLQRYSMYFTEEGAFPQVGYEAYDDGDWVKYGDVEDLLMSLLKQARQ